MRFHCGISFSWRTIKKFLLPFGLGLLAYLGFNGIFDNFNLGFIKTYAYQNYDTYYNVKIDEDYITDLQNQYCDDLDLLEYFDYIISSVDWSSSYFQAFSGLPQYSSSLGWYIDLVFYPTQNIPNDILQYRGTNKGRDLGWPTASNFQMSPYESTTTSHIRFLLQRGSNNRTCFLNTNDYGNFREWGSTLNYIYYIQNGSQLNNNNTINDFSQLFTGEQSHGDTYYVASNTTINNTDSYNNSFWFFWSSMHYKTNPNDMTSNTWWYYKKIYLVNENITYNQGDYVEGYYSLHRPTPTPQFIGYQTELNTFYTNMTTSQLSSYNLQVNFKIPQSILGYYQTPQEYIDNTQFDYICSGRVNPGGYYFYESFPCSLSSSYTTTNNTITYTFNNVTYTQNISNYDKIYVTINPKYNDSSVSTTIFNLNYTFTNGYFYNTSYKGAIYERLSGLLTLDFKLYFSSNNSPNNSNLYIDTTTFDNTIYSLGFSNTSHNEFYQVGQSILGNPNSYEILDHFRLTRVSNSFDTGIMVYQQNGSTRIPYLNLFFNGGMYISQNIGNDSFYYIDSNGTIQNGSFSPPLINQNDDYNINSYVSIVNDFIDSMSESSAQFGIITQNFYDTLPTFFQTFIFVVFILFCLLFTYLLIKRK